MSFYRLIISLCMLGYGLDIHAQNLVPNPSFERLKQKPCKIITNPLEDNVGNYVASWVSPTNGTADIHTNEAQPDTACRIGLVKTGYAARSGNVCAGFFTGTPRSTMITQKPYREYLQCKLIQKLTPGKIYYVELYVKSYPFTDRTSYYTNNIGCYFSTDSIFQPLDRANPQYILSYKPQVNETQIITQTQQWHKVSSCFQATEAAQYLTIGNFYTDAETRYLEFNKREQGAYYLVDDVSVTETSLTSFPTLAIQDTTLCPARQIILSLTNNPLIQYQWQDGTTSSTYTISQAGIYSVTATSGLCVAIDSFKVIQEITFRLPADTTLCRGSTFLLIPISSANSNIYWSDGSQGPSLSISENGIYWARSESHTCQQIDSVRVNLIDCPGTIPNVFTPNEDGINDTFFISGIDKIPWRLEVYNRWGTRIYYSNAYRNDWAGERAPTGVYYYLLSSSVLQKQYKGWVQIIR